MRNAFAPNASMRTLTREGLRFEPIDGWVNSVGRAIAGHVLEDRLANPVVHVDRALGNIWVDYWFFAGERFSHGVVDAVLLARQGGAWTVFSVVDTRRAQGGPGTAENPRVTQLGRNTSHGFSTYEYGVTRSRINELRCMPLF